MVEAIEEVDEVGGGVEGMMPVVTIGAAETVAAGVMKGVAKLAGTNEVEMVGAEVAEVDEAIEMGEVSETTEFAGGDTVEVIGTIVIAESVDSDVTVD